MTTNPYELAEKAAEYARAAGVPTLDAAMVLGSGWSSAVKDLGSPLARLTLADIPGFHAPAVAGHGGELIVLRPGGATVGVFTGRTHFYEGRGVDAVVHGVRTAAALGARTLVLTNAAGSLNPAWGPGTVVAISDHINMSGASPLVGARFVDLSRTWAPHLIELAHRVDADLVDGVYVQVHGPHYETPAEVRMLRGCGADLVGMSTTLEAIAATEAGMAVLGLSLVTNLGAGVGDRPLDHHEVLDAATAAEPRLARLLTGIATQLTREDHHA